MNAKINKLRGELAKNKNKISELQSRNREIERQITELENNDILELVHSHDLDITQLTALIEMMKNQGRFSGLDMARPGTPPDAGTEIQRAFQCLPPPGIRWEPYRFRRHQPGDQPAAPPAQCYRPRSLWRQYASGP